MAKFIMIFASMTGNTEEMADAVAEGVKEAGGELEVKDVMDAQADELADYDGILLGAYTWGDGELPDEFLDFYDDMEDVDLTGKRASVFGSCDSAYPEYGAAVDLLEERLKQQGAALVQEGLKVELCPSDEDTELCKNFGRTLVKAFVGQS